MAFDVERLAQEEARVLGIAVNAIERHWSSLGRDAGPVDAKELATTALRHFVAATAPELPEVDLRVRLIVMGVGPSGPDFDSAQRVKPGHIRLNFGRFAAAVSSGVLSAVGVPQAPWTLPFAALVIWDTLWSSLKVNVTEREAAVIWTMWTRRDDADEVPDADLLDAVNHELTANGRQSLGRAVLNESLAVLQRIGCIERSSREASKWWLREWVSVRFT